MNATRTGSRDPRGSRRPGASRSSNAVRQALRGEAVRHEPLLAFSRTNWLLMGGGVAAAAVGFLLLSRGDTVLAPLLLVLGYCALIPLGIVWRDKPGSRANSSAG